MHQYFSDYEQWFRSFPKNHRVGIKPVRSRGQLLVCKAYIVTLLQLTEFSESELDTYLFVHIHLCMPNSGVGSLISI